jgi:predicted NBD/HSP70 family sugar kinase
MPTIAPEALGIDVGGSSVKLALLRGGQILWQTQSETYLKPTAAQLASAIRKAVNGRFPNGAVAGICVPGRRDVGGRTVLLSVNLPALDGLNLDDLVRDALGIKPLHVEIATDAVANAYDIYVANQLTGRLLALALGTGVGMAVIDDGGIALKVDGESPGHIGQVDCSIEGEPVIGPDGGAGSLEGYIGAPALTKKYGSDMAATLAKLGPGDAALKALARAIRICHAIYCPSHVALTGGLGNRMTHLLPVIRKLVETNLSSIARPGWTLVCGRDDFHAARGVARLSSASAVTM